MKTTKKVCYSSNNSGGHWWLTDENWHALEAAGWQVRWVKDNPDGLFPADGVRWLGALATEATREGLTLGEAVAEWESVTGAFAEDEGCVCCGQPHYFSEG
jgi:hypothetical protein